MPFGEAQAVHALTVLTRLAQREQDVGQWIHRALAADPAGLFGPAIQVAVETGQPMPRYVNRILAEVELPTEVLVAAQRRIPRYTDVLRATAALIAGQLLERGTVAGTAASAALAVEHAERLLETGDLDRAGRTAQEALAVARQFAIGNPHVVLQALRVLSACQAAAGDHTAAIRGAQEAVNLITLLDVDDPDQEAAAWHTFGQRLMRGGEPARALAAFSRAVACYTAVIDATTVTRPGSGALWLPPVEPTVAPVDPARIGHYYHHLALTLLGQAQVLQDLDRAGEALAAAFRATRILRERAAEAPDAFNLDYAKAVSITANCLAEAEDNDPAGAAEAASIVLPLLLWATYQLMRDAGQRRELDPLRAHAEYLADLVERLPGQRPDPYVAATNAQVDAGLVWLDDDRPAESEIVLTAAVRGGRALVERFGDDGRLPLQRALMAQGRLRERTADPATAVAAAADAVATADSALERVVAAHAHSMRLANAGRLDEALAAARDAVEQLIPVYEPERTDLVFAAATMTARFLALADECGRPDDVRDEVLRFSSGLVGSFPGHRAADTVLENLALLAFRTITAYIRRADPDGVAASHRALVALATAYPTNVLVGGSRLAIGYNAVRSHVRTDRLDLAVEAYEDVAAIAAADGHTGDAVVEQAKCANFLINVYVDTDFTEATALARAAGPALRSPEYLAALPGLGEDDPAGYLEWLDQIAVGTVDAVDANTDPARLAALDADYRATVAERVRTLGEDHPATLATRWKLAEILRLRGLLAEAEAELVTLLAAGNRLWGPEDPETQAVAGQLAALRDQL